MVLKATDSTYIWYCLACYWIILHRIMYVFGIVWYIKALYGIVRCRARPCETSPRPAMAYAQGIALSKLAPLYDIIYILGLFAVLYIILLLLIALD